MGLTTRERAVLDFERGWWLGEAPVTKAVAIRSRLALSATSYYAVLAGLIDSSAAVAYDPLVVHRLRRRRTARRRAVFAGEEPRRRQPR